MYSLVCDKYDKRGVYTYVAYVHDFFEKRILAEYLLRYLPTNVTCTVHNAT